MESVCESFVATERCNVKVLPTPAGTLSGGITGGQGEFPIAITIVLEEGPAAGGATIRQLAREEPMTTSNRWPRLNELRVKHARFEILTSWKRPGQKRPGHPYPLFRFCGIHSDAS